MNGSRYAMVRTPGRWIFVGVLEDITSDGIILTHAHCVRVWGTKNGLGEIADGPGRATILDPMGGRMRIDRGPGVFLVEMGNAWGKALGDSP